MSKFDVLIILFEICTNINANSFLHHTILLIISITSNENRRIATIENLMGVNYAHSSFRNIKTNENK